MRASHACRWPAVCMAMPMASACGLCVQLLAPAQVLQPLFLSDATNPLSPCFFLQGFPHGCKVLPHETHSGLNVQVRARVLTIVHNDK